MGCNKGIQLLEDKINDLMIDIDDYIGSDIETVTSFLISELKSTLEDASLSLNDYDEAGGIMSDFLDQILSGDLPVKESFTDAIISGRFIETVYDSNVTDIPIDYFDNTTDRIFKDETVEQSRIDSNFLQKYFGVNTGARLYAEQIWKEAFVNNILVDRENGKLVTADDIDANMRHYQERMFDIVRDYIMSKVTDPEKLEKLKNLTMFTKASGNKALNREDYNYLFNLAKEHLGDLASFNEVGDGTYCEKITHQLTKLHEEMKIGPNKTIAKQRLDAYLAWVMLDPVNLDVYLKQQLGKAIEINDFGDFQKSTRGYKKYRISSKATNTVTTWRSNDEIFVEEEIDNVIHLLVDTSKIYHYGQMEPSADYMNFGQFQNVITEIKNLASKGAGNVNLEVLEDVGLSEQSLKAIELPSSGMGGAQYITLGTLINMIRRNPQKYLGVVFEILANPDAYDAINGTQNLLDNQLKTLKDIIYSIYKNIFDREVPDKSYNPSAIYSLKSIHGSEDLNHFVGIDHNLFAQMTQVCDSIFGVHIVGYNYDSNTLSYKLLNLDANQVQKNIFAIQSGIRSKLNIYRLADYDSEVVDKYAVNIDNDTLIFSCSIGNNVVILKKNGTLDQQLSSINDNAYNDENTLKAIDEILGLNLRHNTELYNAILQEYNNDSNAAISELLTIAAHALLVQEFNHRLLDKSPIDKNILDLALQEAEQIFSSSPDATDVLDRFESIKNIKDENLYDKAKALVALVNDEFAKNIGNEEYLKQLDSILNRLELTLSNADRIITAGAINTLQRTFPVVGQMRINQTLEQIDPVLNSDFQIYKKLAEAKSIAQGITASGQFKDSENKALSKYTPSRLLGSYRSLWEIQNKGELSTTRDLSIIKDNQLVIDVFKCREAKGQINSKQETKMTVNELFHSGFLLDFVGGLVDADLRKEIIGSDGRSTRVAFYPSVNSDKGEIDKLVIDLSRPSPIYDDRRQPIAWKDLNIKQLETAINIEIGTVYRNQYQAVMANLNTLAEFANETMPEFNGECVFDPSNDFHEFNTICEKFERPSLDVLQEIVDAYNKQNPDNFIQLTDEIHYQKSGNKIVFNKAFLQAYYRTNYINDDRFDNSHNFWQKKRNELLKSLVDSNFELLLDTNSEDAKIQYLLKQKDWVDKKTGKLILAKIIMDGGEVVTIKNAADYKQYVNVDNPHRIPGEVILNPELDRWNMMDYLFSQSFIMTTVGTHFTHPGKMKVKINSRILNTQLLEAFKSSQFIFASPATGKSFFIEHNQKGNIIDWDAEFNDERNEMIYQVYQQQNLGQSGLSWLEFKDAGFHQGRDFVDFKVNFLTNWQDNSTYQAWIRAKLEEVKVRLEENPNLKLLFSPIPVLNAVMNDPTVLQKLNGGKFNVFAIDLDAEEMAKRHVERNQGGAYTNEELYNDALDWKASIDGILDKQRLGSDFYIKLGKGEYVSNLFNYTRDPEIFLWEDAARFNAQHKRNVSMSASMQEFQLGLLDGIQSRYRIAVLPDVKDTISSVEGKVEDGVKPFDGATFCNPFTVYYENKSLGSARAGIHKKQFVHAYDERFTNGVIVKTAGFGITNEWIREGGRFMDNMMRKLTDIPWMYLGEEYQVDITENYWGYGVELDPLYIKGSNGEIFKIVDIDHYDRPNGEYVIEAELYSSNNTPTGRTFYMTIENGQHNFIPTNSVDEAPIVSVKSNYDLWQLYGGVDSVEYNNREGFIPSEASIKAVVDTANQTGVVNEEILEQAKQLPESERARFIKNAVETQDDVFQVIKYSDNQYGVTEGAIKQGAANRNTDTDIYRDNTPYRYMYINMNQAGIQLDKEHHANDSEISIMTQVISACASMGWTQEQANKMYHALGQLTELAVKDNIEAFEEFFADGQFNGDRQAITKSVTETIVNAIMSGKNNGSILDSIATELLAKANSINDVTDEDIAKVHLPVSAQSVYPKVISTLSSMFTRNGIKMKFSGLLAVLCPSFNIMKIYGDKMYSAIGSEAKLAELQEEYDNKYLAPKDVRIGRKYKIRYINESRNTVTEIVSINNPIDYSEFKKKYEDPKYHITEYIMDGRELGGYNATFKATNIHTGEVREFSIYDLDTVQRLADRDEKIARGELTTEDAKELRKQLQYDLASCSKNGPDTTVQITYIDKYGLELSGEWSVDKESIEVEPYEIIMPKVFSDQFGLRYGDDVEAIKNNPFFFVERMIENMATKLENPENYSVELKMMNGEHIYLLDKQEYNNSKGLESVKTNIRTIDGKTYHCDGQDNPLFEMKKRDKLYVEYDHMGNPHQVIVTDDMQSYIDNFEYFAITLSPNLKEEIFNNIIEKFNNSDNRIAENFMKFVNNANGDFKRIKNSNQFKESKIQELLNNLSIIRKAIDEKLLKGSSITDIINYLYNTNNSELNKFRGTYKQLISQGLQIHESFKKSLEIVAARVPSQSMQSFMPMKIVGFVKSNTNNAFVSTYLIWLQGSDYDIDAVTLLMYEFNRNGTFAGWSPYFNTKSEDYFKISSSINYPTGNNIELVDPSETLQNSSEKDDEDYQEIRRIFAGFVLDDNGKIHINYDDIEAFEDFVNFLNMTSEEGEMIDLTKIDLDTLNDIIKDSFTDKDLNEDDVDDIQQQIIKIINDHNNYIRKNPSNTERFTKNYVVNQVYDIIADPINLLLAQTPVDESTGGPKKVANGSEVAVMRSKLSGPGNVGNKYEALFTNQTGKDGIGICAVALKTFFAFTLSYNNTLSNGDAQEIKQVMFDRNIHGKHYQLLANIKTKRDLQQLNNADIIKALAETENDADAVIVLSALLSLATDNAKELCLEKLNADTNLIGMYVYGLSIGMDFKEVAKIMMSPMANTIRAMLQGNIFTDDSGQFQVVRAVDSLVNGPKGLFAKYSMPLFNEDGKVIQKSAVDVAMAYFPKIALTFLKSGVVKYTSADLPAIAKNIDTYDQDLLVNFAWDPNNTLQTKLTFLDEWQNAYDQGIDRNSKDRVPQSYQVNESSIRILRFIEEVKKYFIQVDSVIQSAKMMSTSRHTVTPRELIHDFTELSLGAEEFKVAGLMFGVNQGVKTDQSSILSYVRRFEDFLQDRIKLHQSVNQYILKSTKNGSVFPLRRARLYPWEEAIINEAMDDFNTKNPTADDNYKRNTRDKLIRDLLHLDKMNTTVPEGIDFYQFVLNEKYRKEMINKYESVKHSVNALRVFDNVDHYIGYLRCVFATHSSMYATSAKFRAIIDLSRGLASELNITSSKNLEKLFKNIEQFVNYRIQSQYLFTHDKSSRIVLPAGSKYYDTSFKLRISKTPIPINLGTDHGAATFKMYMDEVVFPNLLNGDLGNNKTDSSIILNHFITSLIRNSYDRNPSHAMSESYHCDLNMLPKTRSEEIQYDGVKKDFDELRNVNYNFEDSSIGLLELIYFYNIIAYGDKVGESTFTKLFDDMLTVDYIKEYNDLIYTIDQGEMEDVIMDFDPNELKLWCILQDNKYNSVMEYIYSRDKNSKLSIYEKNHERGKTQEIGGEEITASNDKYIKSPIKLINPNYNHFMHNLSSSEETKSFLLYQSGNDRITYEREIKNADNTPYYSGNIRPAKNTIFVFGSNPEGRHGDGAAKVAVEKFGAIYWQGEGLQGNAYALPTKDLRVTENNGLRSISREDIIENIKRMYEVARLNPNKTFKVAYRNTKDISRNGYTGFEMIEMFKAAGPIPENVMFSKEWVSTGAFNTGLPFDQKIEYGIKMEFATPGLAKHMTERIKQMAREHLQIIANREGVSIKEVQKKFHDAGYTDVEIALGIQKGRGTTIQFNPRILQAINNEIENFKNPCS